jgi:hypothetical protein
MLHSTLTTVEPGATSVCLRPYIDSPDLVRWP